MEIPAPNTHLAATNKTMKKIFFAAMKTAALLATMQLHAQTVKPAFEPLKFGEAMPRGWVLAQMKRDLATGYPGKLDTLARDIASDIFITGRNRPGKLNKENAQGQYNKNDDPTHQGLWWNGETEGIWRSAYATLAWLTEDPAARAKTADYIKRLLDNRDPDGYIGIFSPEYRYNGVGEPWSLTCLLRGLLLWAEANDDDALIATFQRTVDLYIEKYTAAFAAGKQLPFTGHDHMFADLQEYFWNRTGDEKYANFRVARPTSRIADWFAKEENKGKPLSANRQGHGATQTSQMRIPFWQAIAKNNPEYLRIARGELEALDAHWLMPSGAVVSHEFIDTAPNPWDVGYEYCAMFEIANTWIQAAQKTGEAKWYQRAEHLWYNAMQGSREPDGSACLYCSNENRPTVSDQHGSRQRYSATHQQMALCCSVTSSKSHTTCFHGAWARPLGGEPGIAATIYAPAVLKTKIADTPVQIEQRTNYPYSGTVDFAIDPAKPTTFTLWLRNPEWSEKTKVTASGDAAEIKRDGDWWKVRKEWKAGDTVRVEFDQQLRLIPAINGEHAIQYGPLLYVLPITGEKKPANPHGGAANPNDYFVLPVDSKWKVENGKLKVEQPQATSEPPVSSPVPAVHGGTYPSSLAADLFLPEAPAFTLKPVAEGTNPDYPLDNPVLVLTGEMKTSDGTPVAITLVPMGSENARLRRVTFPTEGKTSVVRPPSSAAKAAEGAPQAIVTTSNNPLVKDYTKFANAYIALAKKIKSGSADAGAASDMTALDDQLREWKEKLAAEAAILSEDINKELARITAKIEHSLAD